MTEPQNTPLRPVMGVGTSVADNMKNYALWAQNAALRLFDVLKHWDAVADALAPYLRLSGAAWWQVGQGQRITDAKINALRAHEGLPLLPARKALLLCSTCGQDHGLDGIPDCHGAPVAAVVCLTPEQTVAKRRTPRPVTKWRDLPVETLARLITERKPMAYGGAEA